MLVQVASIHLRVSSALGSVGKGIRRFGAFGMDRREARGAGRGVADHRRRGGRDDDQFRHRADLEHGHDADQGKHKRWYDLSQEIKGEGKWKRPTEIASVIAKREKGSTERGVNTANIKRRLDDLYPGWAKQSQAQKTGAK